MKHISLVESSTLRLSPQMASHDSFQTTGKLVTVNNSCFFPSQNGLTLRKHFIFCLMLWHQNQKNFKYQAYPLKTKNNIVCDYFAFQSILSIFKNLCTNLGSAQTFLTFYYNMIKSSTHMIMSSTTWKCRLELYSNMSWWLTWLNMTLHYGKHDPKTRGQGII